MPQLYFSEIPVIFPGKEAIKSYPVLYKTTPAGSEIQWHVRIIEDDQGNLKLVTERGQVGGKMVTDVTNIIPKAKRTPLQQAIQEADQRYKLKIRKNYRPETPEGESSEKLYIKPYLLKQYAKFASRIKFPSSIEPKLDGIRGIMGFFDGEIKFFSRRNVYFPNPIKHIIGDFMNSGLPKKDTIFYDGELYIHDPKIHETEIGGALRRKPPYNSADIAFTRRINYWIFDYVDLENLDLTYKERRKNLEGYFRRRPKAKYIHLVPEITVNNHEEIEKEFERFLDEGYEGAVVRNLDFKYNIGGARLSDVQKITETFEEEYKIIGAEKDKYGQVSWILEYTDPKGKIGTFNSTQIGTQGNPVTQEYRQQLYLDRDKYIGKLATVRYKTKTKYGVPKHPGVIKIRAAMS